MSISTALASPPALPLGSSSKHDPALKPNPHPYAIKTTHTALLSRSNSSGHNTPSKYVYTPSTSTLSRSPTKHAHEYRGHSYSTSLSGELPFPIPSPLPSPTHPQRSESDSVPRRPRADTLPTYLTDNDEVLSTEPSEDLPLNPKTWTPSQLSVYLTQALRVRSGERLPERVANDITSWVRREGVSGRAFLRWTDENLKDLGVNMLWRSALLAASRNLRQNILRGRIWGNPASDLGQEQEQEQGQDDAPFSSTLYASSSSSLDLPLADEDAEAGSEQRLTRRLRVGKMANGRVRGMVDKWERESAESRSPTRSSGRRSRCGSESDNGSEFGDVEDVDASRVPGTLDLPIPADGAGAVPTADDEPSIEELLATGLASSPMDGSWGARAWEEVEAGATMRRIEQNGTVVPRRDANGSGDAGLDNAAVLGTRSKRGGANNSSRRVRGASSDDPQPSRRSAANIFAEPPGTVSSSAALAEAGVQADARAEIELEGEDEDGTMAVEVEAELEAKELALESEARDMRTLLDEFRRRLEDVEARVSAMEVEWHPVEEQRVDTSHHHRQQSQAQEDAPAMAKDTQDKAVEAISIEAGMTSERNAVVVAEASSSSEKEAVRDDVVVAETRDGPANLDTPQVASEDGLVRHVVDLGPTTVAELPSYVLLVGLGVCTVVLQVMLKGVGGRSMKALID